jgi:hypothetical protein
VPTHITVQPLSVVVGDGTYLSGNQLDGVLPREVGQLVKLAVMALSRNRFTGDAPVWS